MPPSPTGTIADAARGEALDVGEVLALHPTTTATADSTATTINMNIVIDFCPRLYLTHDRFGIDAGLRKCGCSV